MKKYFKKKQNPGYLFEKVLNNSCYLNRIPRYSITKTIPEPKISTFEHDTCQHLVPHSNGPLQDNNLMPQESQTISTSMFFVRSTSKLFLTKT